MRFPDFLSAYDETTLASSYSTLVALDPDGTICWTNPAWSRFALENGGPDVPARFTVGTSYYAGISTELRGFYEEAFARALASRTPFEQQYECSSAEVYRMHHLRVLPVVRGEAVGLLLEHSCIASHAHGSPEAERLYRDASGIMVQCSNCRRTRRADDSRWDWVPAWVERSPPRTSHGICKTCVGFYWGTREKS